MLCCYCLVNLLPPLGLLTELTNQDQPCYGASSSLLPPLGLITKYNDYYIRFVLLQIMTNSYSGVKDLDPTGGNIFYESATATPGFKAYRL